MLIGRGAGGTAGVVVTGGMWAGERGDWSAKCDESVLILGREAEVIMFGPNLGAPSRSKRLVDFPKTTQQ